MRTGQSVVATTSMRVFGSSSAATATVTAQQSEPSCSSAAAAAATSAAAMGPSRLPVSDSGAVPFQRLGDDLEFRLLAHSFGAECVAAAAVAASSAAASGSTAAAAATDGEIVLRHAEGATIFTAACGAAHTVVLVRNPHRRRDSWHPSPITFLFGCGRARAVGEAPAQQPQNHADARTLPPIGTANATRAAVVASTTTSSTTVRTGGFHHLPVGDGEDLDALWAFGDTTFARGRRGLVVFGSITDGTHTYASPNEAHVVVPAPLGCLVKEVVWLNAVAGHAQSLFAFVELAAGLDDHVEVLAQLRAASGGAAAHAGGISGSSSSSAALGDGSGAPAGQSPLFDATRLLEIHSSFPAGVDGELRMLHPPPPIFSFADATERVLGPVASILRRAGAPLFRIKRLCCGNEHAVGTTVDGAVFGWGSNHFGQLGDTAGGAERGPQFADERAVGPRSARLYPTPDCSGVPSRLRRQYYDSAVLLRPPSLRRSPLVLAAAHAMYKGRTVEFNEVISVVPIPAIGDAASNTSGSVGGASDQNRSTSPLSPLTQAAGAIASEGSGGDGFAEDAAAAAGFRSVGDRLAHQDGATSSGSSAMKRKGTAAPRTMRMAAQQAAELNTPSQSPAARSVTGSEIAGTASSPDRLNASPPPGSPAAALLAAAEAANQIAAVTSPAWPSNTVVDCCCGPLFTTLMQADSQLVFLGDHVPAVVTREGV